MLELAKYEAEVELVKVENVAQTNNLFASLLINKLV